MKILQVIQEHTASQQAGGFASGAQPGGEAGAAGDPVAKLERLAALRDSGALTKEEFEQQQKILGEG